MTFALTAVSIPDPPERWSALGFTVVDGVVGLAGVRIGLGAPALTVAIAGVSAIEGLALEDTAREDAPPGTPTRASHPNGAVGVDHVVALTPDFEATTRALERAGLPLKRIRDGGGFRQGFRRLGGPILELVESPQAPAPAWWGLTVTVADLDALPADLLTAPKPAVQPGRFICRARSEGVPLAFMTPEPG